MYPLSSLTVAQISFAGFLSAIPMNIISTPFDQIKVLLQTQGQTSPMDCKAPKYARGGGIQSIYKGAAMTFARDGPDSAACFATYEYWKRYKLSDSQRSRGQWTVQTYAQNLSDKASKSRAGRSAFSCVIMGFSPSFLATFWLIDTKSIKCFEICRRNFWWLNRKIIRQRRGFFDLVDGRLGYLVWSGTTL